MSNAGERPLHLIQEHDVIRLGDTLDDAHRTASVQRYMEDILAPFQKTHLIETFRADTAAYWKTRLVHLQGASWDICPYSDPVMDSYWLGGQYSFAGSLLIHGIHQQAILDSEARPALSANAISPSAAVGAVVAYQGSLDRLFSDQLESGVVSAASTAAKDTCVTMVGDRSEHEIEFIRGFAAATRALHGMRHQLQG